MPVRAKPKELVVIRAKGGTGKTSVVASRIEADARSRGLTVAGRVRYDRAVTDAQIRKQAVVEYQSNGCAEDIRTLWTAVRDRLGSM